jgi:hypothetical protein
MGEVTVSTVRTLPLAKKIAADGDPTWVMNMGTVGAKGTLTYAM